MKISEMITDKYKLRIPPTVYYDLLADVQEMEGEQEPTTKNSTVSLETYMQVVKERDIAIEQLHELGYEFGEKIEPTTKNDLGVDLISRADVLKLMQDNWHTHNGDWAMQESMDDIRALPSVTPQEPTTFQWCHDCKEYDQEKHCCHRWSKVIRDTVEEMKQEQEPIIDKIRTEIDSLEWWCNGEDYFVNRKAVKCILDKYKGESEVEK